ncbi:MAG: DUF1343 domain-containing protein [Saprospiraceae bacterium]
MFFFKLFLSSWILIIAGIGFVKVNSSPAYKILPPIHVPIAGASNLNAYLRLIRGKRVGMVVNQTSILGKHHLVDSLLKLKINITKILVPEHGIGGDSDAGEKIKSSMDESTGILMLSIYGDHRKPTGDDLKDLDIIIFDIQDIGVRFYTYIATMSLVMEACAEHHVPVIVLDRPNPNGYYVDGPVLKEGFESFVGMHPVPVVYGLSIGEYALMINGEGWLANKVKCDLTVIPCKHYDHTMTFEFPVKPSPNIPNLRSILLYPSICFFEGTDWSEGRGTSTPFVVFGHPKYSAGDYQFTPISLPGAKSPKLLNQVCQGHNLSDVSIGKIKSWKRINLHWLLKAYENVKNRDSFFSANHYFDKLAGTNQLMAQIKEGESEAAIRASWKADIAAYMLIRKKYLLYKDFEYNK